MSDESSNALETEQGDLVSRLRRHWSKIGHSRGHDQQVGLRGFLQDGSEHHRARKLLMPAFLGKALRGYRSLVADVATADLRAFVLQLKDLGLAPSSIGRNVSAVRTYFSFLVGENLDTDGAAVELFVAEDVNRFERAFWPGAQGTVVEL